MFRFVAKIFSKLFHNALFRYLFSRYLTYFIQFVSSIFIARSLGPFYFGIWGFILLIINYFRIFDFGISNATSVLLVQNRDNKQKESLISTNSIFLVSLLGLIITLFAVYYYFFGFALFDKYHLNNYFYLICIIGILSNYNVLLMSIYRVNNSLKEISIYQSVIPLLCFAALFLFKDNALLIALVFSYIIGNVYSLVLFIKNKKIPKLSVLDKETMKQIFSKSLFLFFYNVSFYLIIVSIRTLISIYYSVEEFGYFSFAYSLANSILLFLQALTFVIFPKVIHKLKDNNYAEINKLILNIRDSYVTLSFGLIFLGTILYPVLLYFVPKYADTYDVICYCALATVLYTNSFGYGSFLMAQNKERLLAALAFGCLAVNIGIAYILIDCNLGYQFVIFATMAAYILYTFLCTYFAKRLIGVKEGLAAQFLSTFPIKIFLPFCINLALNIMDLRYLLWLPFALFLVLNYRNFREIKAKFKKLLNNPNSINI